MLLSFLLIFRHVAEPDISDTFQIRDEKERFSFANGIIYFSVKYKLGIGARFELNKVSSAKLY